MAIKKFATLTEALAAGYTVVLGNGEYAQGGEEVSRDRYPALTAAIGATAPGDNFTMPDLRGKFPAADVHADGDRQPEKKSMAKINIQTGDHRLVEAANAVMRTGMLDFSYEDRISGGVRRVTGKVVGITRPDDAPAGKPFVIHVEGEEIELPD